MTQHHEIKRQHHVIKKKKSNMWMIISGILFILLLVSFFQGSGKSIKPEDAKAQALNFINGNLLRAGTVATISNVEEENGLYKMKLVVEGQEFDSYMTLDGKLLFPSAVDMTAPIEQPAQPTEPTQPTTPGTPVNVDLTALEDDDAVKGDPNAPVTIVEFSDYECPFCGRYVKQTYPQITKEYIDTGKVRYIFRDFPLSFHAQAQKSAEAAECAGEQGKYYEMHDILFEKGVNGGVPSFKQYAKDIGLNSAAFDTCLDSGSMAQEVKNDMAEGQAAGITGTPGFIINGQKVSGAQPFSVFQQIIEAELN